MTAMSSEDQELMQRLKAKYAGLAGAGDADAGSYDDSVYEQLATRQQPALPPASAAGVARPGDNVDVKICGACQGTGVQVEEYNHRRLEKFCQPCGGRGANVYKDGKEVADPVSMQADSGASIGGGRSARAARRGAAVSAEAGLAALDAKLRQYADERAAALSGSSSDNAEGARLRSELVAALDAQIGKLSRMREARAARLDEC